MFSQPIIRVSEEEYFALLQASTEKLEYHDGEVMVVVGANLVWTKFTGKWFWPEKQRRFFFKKKPCRN